MAMDEWEQRQIAKDQERRDRRMIELLEDQNNIAYGAQAAQLAAQQEDIFHAARMREERVAAANAAARAAEEARDLAETQLEEARAHNFTMWRQGTANGAAYDEWHWRAAPLVDELRDRDARWAAARDADIKAHSEATTSEVLGKRGLDHPRFGKVKKEAPQTTFDLVWMMVVMPALVAAIPVAIWLGVCWVANLFLVYWSWQGFVFLGIAIVALAVCWPGTIREYRLSQQWHAGGKEAREEIEREKSAFEASIPASWHSVSGIPARDLLETAGSTIDSMPTGYTSFRPSDLTELAPVPPVISADGIDGRAANTLALVREWGAVPAA